MSNRNFFNSSATVKLLNDETGEYLLFANSIPSEGNITLTGLTKSTLYKNDFPVIGEEYRLFVLPSTHGEKYIVTRNSDNLKDGESASLTLIPSKSKGMVPNYLLENLDKPVAKDESRVNFYSTKADEKYKSFSNFSYHKVNVFGRSWLTSEHAFQAQKFINKEDVEQVFRAKTPSEAARIGRDRTKEIRKDWNVVRVAIMYEVVRAKFTQHYDLRTLLLSTGTMYLSEHTQNDNFWGDGGDDSGKNMLGRLLMLVREEIK